MDARRLLRFGSSAEWTIAVVFLAATVGVGTLIVHELTSISSPAPALRPAPAATPATLPAESISVEVLPLGNGEELRLGDGVEKVNRLVRNDEESGRGSVEQAKTGTRVTRYYQRGTMRFVLVLEPFERNGELKVVGIYVR